MSHPLQVELHDMFWQVINSGQFPLSMNLAEYMRYHAGPLFSRQGSCVHVCFKSGVLGMAKITK